MVDGMDDDDDDEDDKYVPMLLLYIGNGMNPDDPVAAMMSSLGWWSGIEESLAFGDGVEFDNDDDDDDKFLSRFLIVEFQKFLISLSVRPGNLAAIWDHLFGDNNT